MELVQIRVTLSAALLGIFFGIFRRTLTRIRIKDILYFLLLGGAAMAMVQVSYFFAISKIQVSAAILLQYLGTILIAAYSIAFWHERLTAAKIAALFLAMGGCFLVVGGYDLHLLELNRGGIVWGLVSAVSFASYTLLAERGLHRYSPWTVIFYAFLFAALTLNILYKPTAYLKTPYSLAQWGWLLYIAIMGTIIPFGLYLMGVSYIRSTRASITAIFEPVSAALIAFLALGEILHSLQIIGGISAIFAIVLLQLQREHDEMAPELIRMHKKGDPDCRD
ncbi:MAG: EamA family transporter [Deltaproteobacteria bacterium]|nr:EamA family transporter [Deltaproteobacteria bacterium]MBN2845374.1 EamA family transporter [Deltaproteobacteria bacterium]